MNAPSAPGNSTDRVSLLIKTLRIEVPEYIADIWKERRGIHTDRHYFEKILVNSENPAHVFIRTESRDDIVVVVVCRKQVNTGMSFAQARRVVEDAGQL